MKTLYNFFKICLIISMIILGIVNFMSSLTLFFDYKQKSYAITLISVMVVSYLLVAVFKIMRKHLLMFFSSLVFPITSIIIGLQLKAIARGNLDFTVTLLKNHMSTAVIPLFALFIFLTYRALPSQKAKRFREENRNLRPEERII